MATTKFSVSAYTADGITTDYLITWDYLDSDHIAVYVDGTPNYDPQSTYSFDIINPTTVRVTDEFGNAVPSGSEIEIRRETPILDRAVTFNDGSALLAEDLNKNSDYLLYSMQEVLDTVEAAAQDGALAAQVATEALRDETEILRATTEGYKNTTATYLASAIASENASKASELAAKASEVAAAGHEANSAASELAAASSANNAQLSEDAANQHAVDAENFMLAADSYATFANQRATDSEVSSQASEAAANAAVSAYQDFQLSYLGPKTSAPSLDNSGNPLLAGMMFFNTTTSSLMIYDGAFWDDTGSSVNGTSERYSYIASAGQVSFPANYDSGFVDVFVNGIKKTPVTDFTENVGGTEIILNSGASSGDKVDIIAFGVFEIADTVSKTNGGTFYNKITVQSNSNTALELNRTNSDGAVLEVQKDSVPTGGLYVTNSNLVVKLGTWDVYEDNGSVYFSINNTPKMKLDSNGNLLVSGDVTAYGVI